MSRLCTWPAACGNSGRDLLPRTATHWDCYRPDNGASYRHTSSSHLHPAELGGSGVCLEHVPSWLQDAAGLPFIFPGGGHLSPSSGMIRGSLLRSDFARLGLEPSGLTCLSGNTVCWPVSTLGPGVRLVSPGWKRGGHLKKFSAQRKQLPAGDSGIGDWFISSWLSCSRWCRIQRNEVTSMSQECNDVREGLPQSWFPVFPDVVSF